MNVGGDERGKELMEIVFQVFKLSSNIFTDLTPLQ